MATTNQSSSSVNDFIAAINNPLQQQDALTLLQLMQDISQEKPALWGNTIIGFATYHYKYESGREGSWFKIGFSPRKSTLTIYVTDGFKPYAALLNKLSKHKTGKSCLYVNSLADIDMAILTQILTASLAANR